MLEKLLSLVFLLTTAALLTSCNSPPATFTIGGTVVNLAEAGGGLVLQNNLKDNLSINANGSFVFKTPIAEGSSYSVTIFAQPSNPAQTCAVTNATGVVSANVRTVQVNCGHNEWTWVSGANTVNATAVYGTLGVPAPANTPGARQSPVTWTTASGNFWLFGGQVWAPGGTYALMNDLWKYSSGQWTWMGGPNLTSGNGSGIYGTPGVPGAANIPGARRQAVGWIDASGDFWLFGGQGYDSAGTAGPLNDLWKYSGGQWTWMSGSDLAGQQGSYGVKGVPAPSNVPGGRFAATSWADSSGNLWLFGGFGPDSTGTNGELNELWEFSDGQWTWVGGSNVGRQNGVYGSQGIPAAANVPGARYSATSWIDSSGSFWLFGGQGFDASSPTEAWLSDLWKYSNGQWTWISGPSSIGEAGVYGTRGVAAPGNNPGARQEGTGWIDSKGKLWLFGGNGLDSAGGTGLLNDVWQFSNGQWTWMSGSKLINQSGVYGTQGMPAPNNVPGARLSQCGWIDPQGNLWLFGGFGVTPTGSEGNLNDLWMYMP
jgi:hypothetical protein